MIFGEEVPAIDAASVPAEAYLLDVREPGEWAAGHAPEAVHIPMNELTDRAAEIPREREVYVICRSGGRSAQVTIALNNAGWQALNVAGGMQSWEAAGRPMMSESDSPPFVA